jgi:hypothetical protein
MARQPRSTARPPAEPVSAPVISKNLDKTMAVIEELRRVHSSINSNAIVAFLVIASNPGITVQKVQEKLGQDINGTSRSTALLMKWHRAGQPGLDLVYAREDVFDRRVRHLLLNPNGQRVWNSIKRILEIKE